MGIFSKQKNIIFISQSRVRAARVSLGRSETSTVIEDTSWTKETLGALLVKIHAEIGSDVRIVLGEDLGYVVSFSLKNIEKYTRATIKQEAQGFIPESLDEVAWDFQSIAALCGDKRIGISKGVQVVAVSKFFLHDIAPVFVEAGFMVEALETESCALARLMQTHDEAILIVHVDHGRNLLVVLERGVVMATESLPVTVSSDHIEKVIASVSKQFALHVASIIISDEATKTLVDVQAALLGKGFQLQEMTLDPMIGIARKVDIAGDDAQVLNVHILPQEKQKVWGLTLSSRERRLLIVFFTALIVGGVALAGVLFLRKVSRANALPKPQVAQPSTQTPPAEMPEVIVQQPAQSDAQNTASYTMRILNGSGHKGEAARVEILLASQEFAKVSIGNADNDRYIKTLVRAKGNIPQSLAQTISQTLSSQYVVEQGEILDDTAEDDIIVVVGSQKNK